MTVRKKTEGEVQNMQFENVKATAARLNVTVRAIQKWAKEGKIPDAYFDNRVWWIPKDFKEPLKKGEFLPGSSIKRYQLPLLRSSFEVGKAKEFIESIPDPDDKNIAIAEYLYYTGHAEEAAQLLEQYFDSKDDSLRYSANVMCTFANIFRGHIHLASFFSDRVSKELEEGLKNENSPKELHAIGVLTAYIGKHLLNVPVPETSPLEEHLHFLPNGIRLYGAYILAYKAYKEKNFERAIGICDTALAFCNNFYPIAAIYVLIVAAASFMGLKKPDIARQHFMIAWEKARKDGFIKLFGIHHNLLQGLTEQCLKHSYPDEYKQIMRIVKEFNDGWYRLHKPDEFDYSHTLAPVEISIALLYNRDWSAKEIAAHLNLSERTVKNHIRTIFQKLCISKKTELQNFLNS